ncbi:MAG: ATP-binding cassette domain-containing protein [Bacteroidales bacterium]|nr:ATP-binding cassette domain-containing protein [Bacteroidales bacterium]
MSEEILKALMQLFAIIAKQDEGVEITQVEYVKNFLQQQLREEEVKEYFTLFEQHAGLVEGEADEENDEDKNKVKLTSVRDSVRILGLCKKINKTLTQKQKVVALVRLFEIVNADRKFTDQRMAIINTVAEVFKVSKEEFISIESFVVKNEPGELDDINILIINSKDSSLEYAKKIRIKELDSNIFILRIHSVDLYFLKYTGNQDIYLNGLAIRNDRIYLFASGSTVKLPKGPPLYYSDVAAHYLADITANYISYEARNLEFRFPNGAIGIRDVSFAETHGRLIGIMGSSGAGKTTLLNVLAGIEKPSAGEVIINNINLHTEKEKLEGVIGLIPQDDLLIEELTVFENLFFNAKLCFRDKSDAEIAELVNKTLQNLGLFDKKDLKVGSPLKKTISGGQRKRLNIALELIREPSILYVDEPTSGLSSRDSENVMDLLRELTLKGKLIFVVIHQPSSEIYKMFDKMIILDTGGYMIYYGNPVEAVMYFKRLDAQINSEVGECPTCGNVNPELIFNIIEAKVVDEFGNYTDARKTLPQKWEEYYKTNISPQPVEPVNESPPKNLNIPHWFRQLKIYAVRDFLSKISNTQYVALSMLEAPVLGFILSFIIRYIEDPKKNDYIFRVNENIHIFIFMSLIVALFLGLMVSAEEIIKDRKLLKRESFLNLSKSSYLISKIAILFVISAVQAFLFVIVANTVLEIKGMYFTYWLALFSTAAFANMLGLNVSATFNSAVTIYIIIPLLMIPMMILSGAMFSFDKMNRTVSRLDKVPAIAEIMVTKWTYEALMVHQFKDNKFTKVFYDLEKIESQSDFKMVYWLPEMRNRLEAVNNEYEDKQQVTENIDALNVLRNEIIKELQIIDSLRFKTVYQQLGKTQGRRNAGNREIYPNKFSNPEKITVSTYNSDIAAEIDDYLNGREKFYSKVFALAVNMKDAKINYFLEDRPEVYKKFRDDYFNEGIADITKKIYESNKILEYRDELVQHYDPIYQDPDIKGRLDFRSHFFSPKKHFFGKYFDTYNFNITVVWILTVLLYVLLYYDMFGKLLTITERFKRKK